MSAASLSIDERVDQRAAQVASETVQRVLTLAVSPGIFTVAKAAAAIGFSPAYLRNEIRAGRLEAREMTGSGTGERTTYVLSRDGLLAWYAEWGVLTRGTT